jgi:membrane protein DedA with SNARE-associated domain
MEHFAQSIIAFVEQHQAWIAPITFLLAFGESLAFISLVLPSTVVLVFIAGLVGGAGVGMGTIFWVWFAAGVGGALGYSVSYWVGAYFKDDIDKLWPFSTRPEMLVRGREFFEKWGTWGVFFGHFFGPVRAVIPVVAGSFAMRQFPFQVANISSAFLWATGVLIVPIIMARYAVS